MSNILNKRIPTLLGLLLLVLGVLATSYLVNTGVILFGKAAPTENPSDVRVTNVTDTTFTVTYKTDAKVIGTIDVTSSNGQHQTVLDERDQTSGVPKMYNVHSIAVKNAKASSSYTFTITSGTTTYQNNTQPFSAKTGVTITATPSATAPLSGKVLDENGNVPNEAIIFVTTKNGQTISGLARNNGTYTIPLNAFRDSTFAQYLPLQPSSVMQLFLTDGAQNSQTQVLLSNANPVPIITLSNNYNFVANTKPIASSAATFGFPPFPVNTILGATPIITTPTKNENFTDSQPQFTGKGLPNQSVTIEIHSNTVINATVTTDTSGNWIYRPTAPLSPGQHTLSITTKNASGILQTIEQSFTVYAAGSQVSQSATPSGQLTPTVTTTIAPTIAPTTTVITTPTTLVTPKPTIMSPKPTLPPTGSNALTYASLLGIVIMVVGGILFIFTKTAI